MLKFCWQNWWAQNFTYLLILYKEVILDKKIFEKLKISFLEYFLFIEYFKSIWRDYFHNITESDCPQYVQCSHHDDQLKNAISQKNSSAAHSEKELKKNHLKNAKACFGIYLVAILSVTKERHVGYNKVCISIF